MSRVAVFVDVSNLYYNVGKRYPSRKLDYRSYMEICKQQGEVVSSFAYSNQPVSGAKAFVQCLKHIGFITRFLEDGIKPTKSSNLNCKICVDAFELVDHVDTVILGSGSGDLAPLVEWLRRKGIAVYVIAANISSRLRSVANMAVEVTEDLLEELS